VNDREPATGSLDDVVARLDALEHEPVSAHTEVLTDVHRRLVSELDDIAAGVSRPQQSG
jgi:hypothetical protein